MVRFSAKSRHSTFCVLCQTVIDILVRHAFDNIDRFTTQQRRAIEKLWASIHEQQTRRRNGKFVTGKLDMNGFECVVRC
ncbi:hypothetical protein IFM89_017342 [Coptis chinensis]|uniref:Uncharacterized protein n=1 Tax=Coptis chinensis TaxID=261450 RepID=A0A835H6R4_9MAGN|nr:hypothetical protein IFM89_017342 [Coptis chinensis]